MLFKYITNISIDDCKKRLKNNINDEHIIVKDDEVIGWLFGNFIHLYSGFKYLHRNTFKPVFWGYISTKNGKTYIQGLFFFNFGVTLIFIPLTILLIYSHLVSTFDNPSFESSLTIVFIIAFFILIIFLFKKEKKIIKNFIKNTITNPDISNRRLIKENKYLNKKKTNRFKILFKIVLNSIFLILIVLSFIGIIYFFISIITNI